MPQQVACYNIDAPKKSDHVSAKDFCETFIKEYRRYREENPASVKVKINVVVDKTTEQTLYFVDVNKILKTSCPELIPCYTISRRK